MAISGTRNFLVPMRFAQQIIRKRISVMATRTNVRSVVVDAQDKGRDAVKAVGEVGDNLANAIDKSLEKRPYTTLALAVGIGFILGAMWKS
jgi:ElaB/YqjD/DUF883 family membrane-anchored ribosome-binding protein